MFTPIKLRWQINKRYEVIHKLGSGGSSNIWLCCSTTSDVFVYMAVKIIVAECSTYDCPELRINELKTPGLNECPLDELFCIPSEIFDIHGPNGHHFPLVCPVIGPRASRLLNAARSPDPGSILRYVCSPFKRNLSWR